MDGIQFRAEGLNAEGIWVRRIRLGDVGDSCTEGGILGDGVPCPPRKLLGAFRGLEHRRQNSMGTQKIREGPREGRGPRTPPPTRPPRARTPVGATHRSWDGDSLPFPGHANPLVQSPGAPTNDSPLGSVASAVTAVSGLNHLTSHAPPAPGILGGDKNARAHAPRSVPATSACAAASVWLPQACYSAGSSPV